MISAKKQIAVAGPETRQPSGGKMAFYLMGNLEMEIYEADELSEKDGAIDHIALDRTVTEYEKICKKLLTGSNNRKL